MRVRGHVFVAMGTVIAVLAALICLALPAAAMAAPTGPTMNLTQLQSILDTNTTVPGHFKTVLKGSTIDDIDVDILGITTLGNADLGGAPPRLVMFQAKDARIDAIGGIAGGMSGSPLYVNVGGVDMLLGAVSYGDIFTLHNTGLATPIEYMTQSEQTYPPKTVTMVMRSAVKAQGRSLSTVLVAPNDGAARKLQDKAGAVFAPLSALQLGGLPQSSQAFKALEKHLSARGLSVVSSGVGGGYDPSFETTMEGGASVAALASRGDLWFGAAGTVTYADADTVVGFGHPLFWEGKSGLFLTNAWVDGIWPTTYDPYKLIAPTAVRGTMTQDRSTGISGRLDVKPEELPVTSEATMTDESVSATSASWIPSWAADSSNYNYQGIPAIAASVAGMKAQGASAIPGSAHATATIVVSDGTKTHTIVRSDLYDDSSDIGWAAMTDVSDIVGRLQMLDEPGTTKAHLVSVDLKTTMTSTRHSATITDVKVIGGLHYGINRVVTSLKVHGQDVTKTVETSLYIPKTVTLTGYLDVSGGSWSGDSYYSDMIYDMLFPGESVDAAEESVADVAANVAARPKNTEIVVTYHPNAPLSVGSSPISIGMLGTTMPASSYTAKSGTSNVIDGDVQKTVGDFWAYPRRSTQDAGQTLAIYSGLYAGSYSQEDLFKTKTFTVMRKLAGSSKATTLAVEAVSMMRWGPFYQMSVADPALWRNTTYTVLFNGDDRILNAQSSFTVHARGLIGFSAPGSAEAGSRIALKAKVGPEQPAGSTVTFQYAHGDGWRNIARVRLNGGTKATFSWKPNAGVYFVRAVFNGSAVNSAHTSSKVKITVQ